MRVFLNFKNYQRITDGSFLSDLEKSIIKRLNPLPLFASYLQTINTCAAGTCLF